jgi:hypothetical protein
MARTVTVVFDGEVLRPTKPLDLQQDKEYQVTIEEAAETRDEQFPLAKLARFRVSTGIGDLAEQHDHYLYGTPKR